MPIAALHALASASASKDPTSTGWIFICGGIFEIIYGPMLWRNHRGITNEPCRGLGSRPRIPDAVNVVRQAAEPGS